MPIEVIAALALAGGSVAWWAVTAVLAVQESRSGPRGEIGHATVDGSEGVSVIVPVASPAPELGACVRSLLAMQYSPLEILLVASADDPAAIGTIEGQAAAAPGRVRCLVVRPEASPNPKVGLLAAAVGQAAHDILLFTDDNATSPPTRVQSHLRRLAEGYTLVSAVAVGVGATNFAGQVDAAFMNGYFSRLQLAGSALGLAGVMGKSMMIRRADVEQSGGLLPTGRTLCEDSALQKQIERAGGRTALSAEPMQQVIGAKSANQVWARHRRWCFCRRTQATGVFVAELAVSATVASVAGAIGTAGLGWPWWAGVSAVVAPLYLIEVAFLRAMRWPIGVRYPLVWLMREALVLPLWVAAVGGGRVAWRARRIELNGGSGS